MCTKTLFHSSTHISVCSMLSNHTHRQFLRIICIFCFFSYSCIVTQFYALYVVNIRLSYNLIENQPSYALQLSALSRYDRKFIDTYTKKTKNRLIVVVAPFFCCFFFFLFVQDFFVILCISSRTFICEYHHRCAMASTRMNSE